LRCETVDVRHARRQFHRGLRSEALPVAVNRGQAEDRGEDVILPLEENRFYPTQPVGWINIGDVQPVPAVDRVSAAVPGKEEIVVVASPELVTPFPRVELVFPLMTEEVIAAAPTAEPVISVIAVEDIGKARAA
jgi:hypothetical protein